MRKRPVEPYSAGMITVGVIRNGATYLSQHLRRNDYWSEGESQVQGEWIGAGAKALGLEGRVTEKPFESLRRNRHPLTGEKLTAKQHLHRVAFFDVQISAPKDVSVLAMVGSDARVRSAFEESVNAALKEMERFAAVRERRGDAVMTEQFRLTGNFIGAKFIHDTSRELDPQLHAHLVLANATWDPERNDWYALQPAEMLRASAYLRQVFYRELSGRLRELGYETYGMNSHGFSIRGVEHLRERFSKRTRQVQKMAEEFAAREGRRPSKREVEIMVRESRSAKLTEVSTPEVRARQRRELSPEEMRAFENLVRRAHSQGPQQRVSQGIPLNVLEAALRHVFERRSVVREGEVLQAALELHPDFNRWQDLRQALETYPDTVRKHGELTLRSIRREELAAVQRVRAGRCTRFILGKTEDLPSNLTAGQTNAATSLLGSRDFAMVLVGDAGTGKTTVLTAIEAAYKKFTGKSFLALAPTTRARDALKSAGFDEADTVQRFLVSETLQIQAANRVVLVDEAGLLSTQQLDQLTRLAEEMRARLLLVGDTKQHYSVERGDALRNIIRHTDTPVVRLSEVLRQREEKDKRFSRLLAAGRVGDAFEFASRRGMLVETGSDELLFARAAAHYADNVAKGVDTMVVIPFWDEIERFNEQARVELRRRGLLGDAEVVREAVKPLTWGSERKAHWNQYQVGDRLLFVRDTRFFKRGTAAEVTEILPDGLRVKGPHDRVAKITAKQRHAFDVGRAQQLPVAAGDRLLMRSRDDEHGFANGDFRQVARVDVATNEIVFTDGRTLPADFKAWTYGHALTSYRAQGSTAEESIVVLGEVAEQALLQRQFYVANTRYRGAHRIYVAHEAAILARLEQADQGRELATEFMQRQQLDLVERLVPRPMQRLRETLRRAWLGMADHWQRNRETQGHRMKL